LKQKGKHPSTGFGFGNAAKKYNHNNVIDEDSENEDELITPPTMQKKPERDEMKPKVNPLEMLRQSFVQRKDNMFKSNLADTPIQNTPESDKHSKAIVCTPEMATSASPEKRVTVRENVMNRSKISELKLTSLSERKSVKRELRMNSLSNFINHNHFA
jgi:hypothetical protein